MRIDIITVVPELLLSPLNESIPQRTHLPRLRMSRIIGAPTGGREGVQLLHVTVTPKPRTAAL